MATNTAPQPTASTYSEAWKLSAPVSQDEAIRRLQADDNPKVYRYRRRAVIAMDLRVYRSRFSFVGFLYCDRKGYTRSGTADFQTYSIGSGYRPTVFQSDRFGDFHADPDLSGDSPADARDFRDLFPADEDPVEAVEAVEANDRTELQKALQDLRDLDDRLGTRGSLIDDCRDNLTDAGDPEPEANEATEEERAAWIRRLIASVESELDAGDLVPTDEVEVPVGFPAIRAWGHHLRSLPSFIEEQEALAAAEGAPPNAVFKRSRYDHDRPGQWETLDAVKNPVTVAAIRSRLGEDLFSALVEMGPAPVQDEQEVPEEEILDDDLISVDGIDLEIDRRSAIVRQVLAAAEKLLFSEINGGPRRSVEQIEGLTFYVTPDRADVDAASYAPDAARGRHGWIRFHFHYPIGISYVEMVDRLAPGSYAPELICPGDLVAIPGKTDPVRVLSVVDHHGRQTNPIEIHLENGGFIGCPYLVDGGLIEVR